MLRLEVQDASGNTYDLETFRDEPFNVNILLQDLSDISRAKGSHTQRVRLPLTQQNRQFFGDVHDPGAFHDSNGRINGRYSLKQRTPCKVYYNSLMLLDGYIQLKEVVTHKDASHELTCVVFGKTIDLTTALGEKRLADIDFGAAGSAVTLTSMQVSWLANGTDANAHVRYGIVDRGQNWSFANQTGVTWGQQEEGALAVTDHTPFRQVHHVLESILDDAGFTFGSTFFESAVGLDIYVPWMNTGKLHGAFNSQQYGFNVYLTANVTASNPGSYTLTNWGIGLDGFYDTNGSFSESGGYFTAPVAGRCRFQIYIEASDVEQGDFFRLVAGPPGTPTGTAVEVIATVPSSGGFATTVDVSILAEASNRIYLQYFKTTIGGDTVTGSAVGGGCTWKLIDIEPFAGVSLAPEVEAPDVSQVEFLQVLQRAFNLVFIPDPYIPNKVLIETYTDFIGSGSTKDWTSKLDTSKDVVMTPTADLGARRFELTMAPGSDVINQTVADSLGRVYGRHLVVDPDNEHAAQDEIRIENPAVPFVTSLIPGSELEIFRALSPSGDSIEDYNKVTLAFWNGLVTTQAEYYIYDGSSFTSNGLLHPTFSGYENATNGILDDTLFYGATTPLTFRDPSGINTLYYKYWRPYIAALYSDEARVMKAHFRLTRDDIANFSFGDYIYIKNHRYRVLGIRGFDVTTEAPCMVELLKDVEAPRDCEYIPSDVTDEGQITFTDADGNTGLDGSRVCCTRYGGTWNPGAGKCYRATSRPRVAIGGTAEDAEDEVAARSANNDSNRSNIILGAGSTAKEIAHSFIGGSQHVVAPFDDDDVLQSVIVSGRHAEVYGGGYHYGGGHSTLNRTGSGFHQYGTFIFTRDVQIAHSNTVSLFFQGIKDSKIRIPDQSQVCGTMSIVIMERNSVNGNVVLAGLLTATVRLEKSTVMTEGDIDTHRAEGDYTTGDWTLAWDITTDNEVADLRLTHNSNPGSRGSSYTHMVTARFDYVQVKSYT
jgi:hypothetical protein